MTGAAIPRPILVSVSTTDAETSVVAEVVLRVGSENFLGVAAKPSPDLEEAISEATIRSVAKATQVRMTVDSCNFAFVGDHSVAVVIVLMEGVSNALAGAAIDREGDGTAFARAALDAVNRIVTNDRLMTSAVSTAVLGNLGL